MSHTTSAADSFESNIKKECKQLKLHIKTLTLKQKNNFLNIMETTKSNLVSKTGSKIINLIDIYLIFSLYCQYIICSIESIDIDNEIDFCYTSTIGTNLLILWKNTIKLLPHFFKLLTNLITELKTNSFTLKELAESIILKIKELISETAAEAEAERARAEAKKKAAKAAKAAVKAEEVAAKVAAKVAKDEARAARATARAAARPTARTTARPTARTAARPTARRTSSVIIEAPATMSKNSFYRFLPRLSGLSGLSGIFKSRSRSVPVHIGGTKRKKRRVKCKTCKTYKKQATY